MAFSVLLCLLATPAVAGTSASRYQVILARRPFGYVAEKGPDVRPPPPPPPPPPVLFTRHVRMTAIVEWQGTSWVGFRHTVGKRRKDYFLRVGESEDGITVLAADFARERARLGSGRQVAWISMK